MKGPLSGVYYLTLAPRDRRTKKLWRPSFLSYPSRGSIVFETNRLAGGISESGVGVRMHVHMCESRMDGWTGGTGGGAMVVERIS
jgi:hypothetical protein